MAGRRSRSFPRPAGRSVSVAASSSLSGRNVRLRADEHLPSSGRPSGVFGFNALVSGRAVGRSSIASARAQVGRPASRLLPECPSYDECRQMCLDVRVGPLRASRGHLPFRRSIRHLCLSVPADLQKCALHHAPYVPEAADYRQFLRPGAAQPWHLACSMRAGPMTPLNSTYAFRLPEVSE